MRKDRLVLILTITVFVSPFVIRAQSANEFPGNVAFFKPGDDISELQLTNTLNYPSKTMKISDFKGKPVILDFWSLGCASCIESWPRLLELQRKFHDSIQIVLVNPYDNDSIVAGIFRKRKKLTGIDISFPSAGGDTNLVHLFRLSAVPMEVWVNREGRIDNTTSVTTVSEKNIRAVLDGVRLNIPPQINSDDMIKVDFSKPLFVKKNGGDANKIFWQSTFAKGNDTLPPTLAIEASKEYGSSAICISSIRDMYAIAYSKDHYFNGAGIQPLFVNRIILRMRDTSEYVDVIDGDYYCNKHYVYQLTCPPISDRRMQEIMRGDLKRYIGLDAKWEKRKTKCLVLSMQDTINYAYKSGRMDQSITFEQFRINKLSVSDVISILENRVYGCFPYPPIVDETGFKGLLGAISFDGDITDPKKLDSALRKYKMSIKLAIRMIDMLVLTEPGYAGQSKNDYKPNYYWK